MSKTTTRTTSMNIRLDEDTRRELQEFADRIGIPATTLAAANIKQMLRSGEVRLTTTLDPTPYLEKLMRETDKDIKAGKNLSPVFDSVNAMFDDLEKTS
jgi:antitoxin component of RelBE/YafQ-DinJ toxin-antitoxin module